MFQHSLVVICTGVNLTRQQPVTNQWDITQYFHIETFNAMNNIVIVNNTNLSYKEGEIYLPIRTSVDSPLIHCSVPDELVCGDISFNPGEITITNDLQEHAEYALKHWEWARQKSQLYRHLMEYVKRMSEFNNPITTIHVMYGWMSDTGRLDIGIGIEDNIIQRYDGELINVDVPIIVQCPFGDNVCQAVMKVLSNPLSICARNPSFERIHERVLKNIGDPRYRCNGFVISFSPTGVFVKDTVELSVVNTQASCAIAVRDYDPRELLADAGPAHTHNDPEPEPESEPTIQIHRNFQVE